MKEESLITFSLLIWINLAGLRPRNWNPNLANIYNDQEINEDVRSIDESKLSGDVEEVFEKLRRLASHAPRRLDVLEYCVEVANEYKNTVVMEGYLRCILEVSPLDKSAKRLEHQ